MIRGDVADVEDGGCVKMADNSNHLTASREHTSRDRDSCSLEWFRIVWL